MKNRIFEISFKINCLQDEEANLKSMRKLIEEELQWFGKIRKLKVRRVKE